LQYSARYLCQVKAVGNDIADVMRRSLELERKKSGAGVDDIVQVSSDDVVLIRTRGNCKFRYGIQQQMSRPDTAQHPDLTIVTL